MKQITTGCILFFSISLSLIAQHKVNWVTLAKAELLSRTIPKPIYVDVYTSWCGPCKMMDTETFNNEAVVKELNKNFYAVKFDGESDEVFNFLGKKYASPGRYHQVLDLLRVKAFPTSVFYSADFQVVGFESGYIKPKPFLRILEYISSEKYK